MKLNLELTLTVEQLAEAFCDLDDDAQARFFVECAKRAETWSDAVARAMQWHEVGRHLRNCECSTDGARDMVLSIANGMEP